MDVNLVMFKADGSRRDFPVEKDRIVIGRTNACDLRIPLASVSRKHCELVRSEQGVSIRDLQSKNGTFHNGRRIEQAEILVGDRVVIGSVVFTLEIDGKPEKIETVRSVVGTGSEADVPSPETLDPV